MVVRNPGKTNEPLEPVSAESKEPSTTKARAVLTRQDFNEIVEVFRLLHEWNEEGKR